MRLLKSLCLAICLFTSPTISADWTYICGDGCTAVFDSNADDGTCWICHPGADINYPAPPYTGKVVIPKYILGRKVVGIRADAFKENVNITEIVISGTVVTVSPHTFDGCTGLRVVSFLAGDEPINVGCSGASGQRGAFMSLPLDSIYVDRDITFSSLSGPFEKSELRAIAIGPNVENFSKRSLFADIPALDRIVIPASFKQFPINCFQYTKIREMVIESSADTLDVGGWIDSSMSNPTLKAFNSCAFKRLDIDRPTTGLGGAGVLEELRLGPNAGVYSFENSSKLVKADLACSEIQKNAFSGCGALRDLTLREGVVTIGSKAFANCKSLKSLRLPDSFTGTKKSASEMFYQCKGLKTIENLNTTYIPDEMFAYCDSIEEVVFGEKVDTIGRQVFRSCINLKKVVIPSNVSRIEYLPFDGCTSIESFILEDGDELNVQIWNKPVKFVYFGRQINYDPDSWRYLGYSPFANGRVDKGVEFGPRVKKIAYSYFRNCANLSDVVIGKGVELIETHAFRECVSLEQINIPSNVKSIAADAFYGCNGLKKLSFGGEVISSSRAGDDEPCVVAAKAFNQCPAITEIVIHGNNMPDLQAGAFPESVYSNARLVVPVDQSTLYKADSEWGRFNTIVESEKPVFTGVIAPELVNDSEFSVYSLQGRMLMRTTDRAALKTLAPGIYILKTPTSTTKLKL